MIQQINIKNHYYLFILTLLTIIILVGCSSSDNNDTDPYATYESDFNYLKDHFTSNHFNMETELAKEYYSTTLPDNNFFSEQNDLHNNDPLKPKNRRLLYFSEEKNIATSLGYLFSKDRLEKSFLTIDSVPVELINEQLDYQKYQIPPYIDQFVMTNRHSIILLKVIYIGNSQITDKERIKYTGYVKEFFTNFTDCLANQDN